MVVYLLIAVLLLVLEWVYFKIADKFNIIDKPNLRSSHSTIVLRGGGIIFLFGAWLYAAFYGFTCPWFLLGLTMLGGISFADDIHSVSNKFRLIVHFVAMTLMFYQWGILLPEYWWVVIIALIVCTGIINAYNFMDGEVDIDSTLEEFNKQLYAAGLQDIIDEKQAQLDAWLASK